MGGNPIHRPHLGASSAEPAGRRDFLEPITSYIGLGDKIAIMYLGTYIDDGPSTPNQVAKYPSGRKRPSHE